MKRLTNNLKHTAQLLTLKNGVDENDRPQEEWTVLCDIKYQTLGVTSTEYELSKQSKTEIVKRMRIRRRSINRRSNRIRADGTDFIIERIFKNDKYLELSLSYVP